MKVIITLEIQQSKKKIRGWRMRAINNKIGDPIKYETLEVQQSMKEIDG